MSYLEGLDRTKRELAERFPGWQIWYVPHFKPGSALHPDVKWCARPWPLINAASPQHLAAEIGQALAEAADEWPALGAVTS